MIDFESDRASRISCHSIPVVLIVILAATGLLCAEGITAAEDLETLPGPVKVILFQAQELRNEGRLEESAALIEGYLRSKPDHDGYLLRSYLGMALAQTDRTSDAVEHFEAAVRMKPDHAQSWLGLGDVCYQLERYSRAGEAFHAGFKASPEPDPLVLYYSGVSFLHADQARRSFEVLSELVSGAHGPPELEWCRGYVAASVRAGRSKECKRVLLNLISRNPEDLESWRLLYQAAGSMEDYRQAAVALTIIDYLEPLDSQELLQLADLYLTLDIPAKSTVYYERALDEGTNPALRERLASAYIASHDREKARDYLGRAVKEAPTPRLWTLLGDLNYFDEEYEAALGAYSACAKIDPNPARAFLMMGYCAHELDRLRGQHLRKASEFEETRESAQRLLRVLNELPR
jgi:tetratricopeptide (TPR) repeat protein